MAKKTIDVSAPMRSLREAAGLIQKEVAARRGVSQQAIYDAEKSGGAVSVAKLVEAADAIGWTIEIVARRR